jgi:acyl-CoA oxidase
VQFNLFGGTIVGLGTKIHEKLYDDIDSLKIVGCFCLTELGYGNNAVEMETTSVWDNKRKVFVINTPTVNSQKYWITNGAYHANYAIVFAQTMVNDKNEGINAFIVQLRDENMKLMKGVTIDDMGCKQGMNGVDNARIILRNIEIPKENMLNKLANITDEGKFISSISNRRQRFLAASNRLLSGRLCIASMSIAGTKMALLIANKYASVRLSNGKSGKSDTPISQYQLFQNQISPLIARTIVLNLGLLEIRKNFSDYLLNMDKYSKNHFNHIVRLCCVIKPMIAWHANETGIYIF